jgi:uncharacterized damage-inducible protein DinB
MTNSNLTSLANKPGGDLDIDESLLIQGCIHGVDQSNQLLKAVSLDDYTYVSQGNSSIGTHTRHILDRFHCFFAGLQGGCIDYDDRQRDKSIENSLQAATFALASVSRQIEKLDLAEFTGKIITVRESVYHQGSSIEIPSTVNRELMGLITHSIHHLAIIAIIAKSFGYPMDNDFGKAASTIVYERR